MIVVGRRRTVIRNPSGLMVECLFDLELVVRVDGRDLETLQHHREKQRGLLEGNPRPMQDRCPLPKVFHAFLGNACARSKRNRSGSKVSGSSPHTAGSRCS